MAESDEVTRRFGRAVAQARKKLGKTQNQLARELGISAGHMSNLECGRRSPNPAELPALDKALGTNGRLTRLWDEITDSGDMDFLDKLALLEQQASVIQAYELSLVPGLLQTERYARTIIRAGAPWLTASDVEHKVRDRMKRAERATSSEVPILRYVVDAGVITRVVGSVEIITEQLRKLVELADSGRLTLLVIPDDELRHPGLTAPFSVLSIADGPDLAYCESLHTGQVVEEPAYVANYRLLFGTLQASALRPDESMRFVRDEIEKRNQDDDT